MSHDQKKTLFSSYSILEINLLGQQPSIINPAKRKQTFIEEKKNNNVHQLFVEKKIFT